MINYGTNKPLKVEISYRNKSIEAESYTIINNIVVYTITTILFFKMIAYSQRDKIRDLYDITFICKNYWDAIPNMMKMELATVLSYKGLDYFDYLISTQSDELIDNDKLASDFLDLWNALGLLQ